MIWTADLAYAIGLITTDGSLSKDGRHIELTSKDIAQIKIFAKILKLENKIGRKSSSYSHSNEKKYYRIQFGNVKFYKFLVKIGLMPNKSKNLCSLKIPGKYFADFLRGHLDGDGYVSSFYDSVWKKAFRLRTNFISASLPHLIWLQNKIKRLYVAEGKINPTSDKSAFYLRFNKRSSVVLLKKLYYKENIPCLERKRSKIVSALGIISKQAGVVKLEYT